MEVAGSSTGLGGVLPGFGTGSEPHVAGLTTGFHGSKNRLRIFVAAVQVTVGVC